MYIWNKVTPGYIISLTFLIILTRTENRTVAGRDLSADTVPRSHSAGRDKLREREARDLDLQRQRIEREWARAKQDMEHPDFLDELADNPAGERLTEAGRWWWWGRMRGDLTWLNRVPGGGGRWRMLLLGQLTACQLGFRLWRHISLMFWYEIRSRYLVGHLPSLVAQPLHNTL